MGYLSAEVKSMKEWALYYAELGLAVFPLAYRNKVPAIEGGCKAATTEKSKIERWWNQNPRYNIGIATGNKSNGLEPPTAVQIATHEYSEDSDKIGKFISECLEKSDENLAAKDVYEKYSQWCNDCGLGVDGRTSFYEELKTKNLLSKTGTVTGKTVKNVIKGYSFAEETFHSVDRGLDAPFS